MDVVFFFFSTVAAVAAIIIFLLLKYKTKSNVNHVRNTPPGNLGWPIIGETIDFAMSSRRGYPEKFILDRMKRHSPDVFKTSLVGQNIAVLCGPFGNKTVFSNEDKLFKPWLPRTFIKALFYASEGNMVEESRASVEAVTGFLKPDAVQKYIPIMDYITRICLNDDKVWCPNSVVKVLPILKKLAMTLSSNLFFGITDQSQVSTLGEQMEGFMSGFYSLPVNLPGTSFRRSMKASKIMRDKIVEIVREERARVSSSDHRYLLSHLLSVIDGDGKHLNEMKIAGTMLGVLVASHDNLISLMTNLVFFLADHRDVYARARREQIEIHDLKGPQKPLSWDDTRKMKYCRNIINEVLRLNPPIGNFRETIHEFTFRGFKIPKGWKVFWTTLSTHKDTKYFCDPERFDPSRFEGSPPASFTFVPFGGGRHMCPGNEYARQATLVFMHYLLIKFKWDKLIPNEKIVYNPIPFPQYGLPIKLQLRNEEDDGTLLD